jgi:transporter family-2 protein
MKILFALLVVAAGMVAPTQAGINARLSQWVHSNFLAALVSFMVGTLGLLVLTVALRIPWPSLSTVSASPWWVWIGGFGGAFLVTVTIIAVPKLGATTMFAFFLAGQMLASLILDHFGLLGYPVHPISMWRVVGVFLLCAGVLLIKNT